MEKTEIIKKLHDRNYILDHLFISLQRKSDQNIVKKPCGFEGIESYLHIRDKDDEAGFFFIKITSQLLEALEIEEETAWKYAELHTFAETTLKSLSEVFSEITDIECLYDAAPIFVLTNTNQIRGASAILNQKILSEFATHYNADKLIALPSSIHEFLLLPYDGGDINDYTDMVNMVNSQEVHPSEQLGDRAYIVEF